MRPRTRPKLREQLHDLISPYTGAQTQSRASLWIDLGVVAAIVISCTAVIIEHLTSAAAYPRLHQGLLYAEIGFTALFSVEYLMRWYASRNRWRHPFTLEALIDLIAILPSLLMAVHTLGIGSEFLLIRFVRLFRMLRLLRLLRLLRMFRHGYSIYRLFVIIRIRITTLVFKYRLGPVARLGLIAIITWTVGANLLHLFDSLHGPGHYAQNYWHCYWGVVVFLLSGMDAPDPESVAGKFSAVGLLIAGMIIGAIFTGEVVAILVRSEERRGRIALKPPGLRLEDHVVVLGRNEHLEGLLSQLYKAYGQNHYLLVVCEDAETIPSPCPDSKDRLFALEGNPSRSNILEAANIENARRVVILSSGNANSTAREKDNMALMHALATIGKNKNVPMVVELQESESLVYAKTLGNTDCIVSRFFGEKLMSQAILHPGITEIYDELMTVDRKHNELYRVSTPPHLVGKTFRQAQAFFLDYDEAAILLIGVESANARAYHGFRLGIPDETGSVPIANHILSPDDRLLICALERPSFDTLQPEKAWQNDPNSMA